MITKPGRYSVTDASLTSSKTLPAAASATVNSPALDLGALAATAMRPEQCELVLSVPALALAKLPNTSVMTYTVQASDDATFATGVRVIATTTQTGATGTATQPAQDVRTRLPSDCPRYVRARAVSDAAGADASAASVSLQLAF